MQRLQKQTPAATAQAGYVTNIGNQVTLKWWVAMVLAQANFHLIFSDPDIAWLRDPFHAWDRSYDFQGLSDIRHVNVTTQKHHEITCLRPWMENMYEHGKRSIYPCQSTGLWYMRNASAGLAFSPASPVSSAATASLPTAPGAAADGRN